MVSAGKQGSHISSKVAVEVYIMMSSLRLSTLVPQHDGEQRVQLALLPLYNRQYRGAVPWTHPCTNPFHPHRFPPMRHMRCRHHGLVNCNAPCIHHKLWSTTLSPGPRDCTSVQSPTSPPVGRPAGTTSEGGLCLWYLWFVVFK
jgi:hypothetical protein